MRLLTVQDLIQLLSCQCLWTDFCENGVLVKNWFIFRTGETLEIFIQNQNDSSCLWNWLSYKLIWLKWSLWKPCLCDFIDFQKNAPISENCRICSTKMSRASVVLKFLLAQTLIRLQNATKEWENFWPLTAKFMGHWTGYIL